MLQQRQWRLVYYHPRHRVLLVVKGYKYLVQSHLLHHHPFTSTTTTPILWFANQTESTRLPAKPFRCPGCVVVGDVTTISWHDHHEHYKIMPWNEDNHGFCCCHRNLIMKLEWGGEGLCWFQGRPRRRFPTMSRLFATHFNLKVILIMLVSYPMSALSTKHDYSLSFLEPPTEPLSPLATGNNWACNIFTRSLALGEKLIFPNFTTRSTPRTTLSLLYPLVPSD